MRETALDQLLPQEVDFALLQSAPVVADFHTSDFRPSGLESCIYELIVTFGKKNTRLLFFNRVMEDVAKICCTFTSADEGFPRSWGLDVNTCCSFMLDLVRH